MSSNEDYSHDEIDKCCAKLLDEHKDKLKREEIDWLYEIKCRNTHRKISQKHRDQLISMYDRMACGE